MTDIQTYKTRLEEEKANLEKELATVGQPDPAHPGSWEGVQGESSQEPDPNDRAEILDSYQENRALVDVLNARYQEVNAALGRIAEGTYGKCTACGTDIEEERLDADPAAATCKAHME